MNIFVGYLTKTNFSFFYDYSPPVLTSLQKKTVVIAAAAFACLALAYVLIQRYYFKRDKIENHEEELDKKPQVTTEILTSRELDSYRRLENHPNCMCNVRSIKGERYIISYGDNAKVLHLKYFICEKMKIDFENVAKMKIFFGKEELKDDEDLVLLNLQDVNSALFIFKE